MSPPIYTPDGSEVSEIVLPDGSTASEVIDPDGNVVFEAGPDIPDSGVYLFAQERGTGINAYETNDPGFFTSSDGPNYETAYGGDENSSAITLNNLGDKVYYSKNKNVIRQESLSTAFDLRTNKGVESSLVVNVSTANDPYGFGLVFFDAGEKMYVSTGELTQDGEQRLYDLSTPYDIGTANYIRSDFVPDSEQGASVLDFNPDGTKCFNSERGGNTIAQHDLSTPFDVSTKSNRQAVERAEDNVGFKWSPDGNYAYVAQHTPDTLSRMEATTPFDVTTLSSATQIASETGGSSYNGLFISGPRYYSI